MAQEDVMPRGAVAGLGRGGEPTVRRIVVKGLGAVILSARHTNDWVDQRDIQEKHQMKPIAHILGVTILVACAALGFATTAQAEHEEPITNHEEPVEVLNENNVHCPDLSPAPVDEEPERGGSESTGGCTISMTGERRLRGHLFGIEQTIHECVISFSGRVDEEGEGWFTEAVFTGGPHGTACTLDPCEETNHMIRSWPFHIREDTASVGTQLWLAYEFCVVPKTNHASTSEQRECELEFPFITVGHNYSINGEALGTNHLNATNCEIDGTGTLAAGQIEIQHDHLP